MLRKLKQRILAVDDDPDLCALLTRLFEGTGRFTVATETESCRAVQAARTFRPDILILDVNMPGQTGTEVARELRSEPWLRYRPIIIFTGLPTSKVNLREAMGDGATEFLQKGVTLETLLETVDALLKDAQIREAISPGSAVRRTGPHSAVVSFPTEPATGVSRTWGALPPGLS